MSIHAEGEKSTNCILYFNIKELDIFMAPSAYQLDIQMQISQRQPLIDKQ